MRLLNPIFLVAYVLPLACAMPVVDRERTFRGNGDISIKESNILAGLRRIYITYGRLTSIIEDDNNFTDFVFHEGVTVNLFRGTNFRGNPPVKYLFKTIIQPNEWQSNLRGLYWVVASCENNICTLRGIVRKGNISMKSTSKIFVQNYNPTK